MSQEFSDVRSTMESDLPPLVKKFLTERTRRREWSSLAGRVGRCPTCGKPNPAGITRRCSEHKFRLDVLGLTVPYWPEDHEVLAPLPLPTDERLGMTL